MSTTTTHEPMADKGLKGGSLGLVAVIVIGVASTAPGYSLAASLGFVTGEAGFQAPFIILFAFVPMACIAAAFYYLNKADPDCGTNFTWGVRSLGPKIGWLSGWGCIIADLIIMPNLAGISGQYLVLLFSEDLARQHLADDLDRRDVHHRHDLDLLERHRAVRPHAGRPARDRTARARRVRRDGPVEGLRRRHRDGGWRHLHVGRAELVVVVAVGPVVERDHRRPRRRDLHLLGLGHLRLGERGGEGLGPHARARSGALDGDPARHLPARDGRGGVVVRSRRSSPTIRTARPSTSSAWSPCPR